MALTLTPEHETLVYRKVGAGMYASPSDVIGEALALLEARDRDSYARLRELREAISVGVEQADRGELEPLDAAAIEAEGRLRLKASEGIE